MSGTDSVTMSFEDREPTAGSLIAEMIVGKPIRLDENGLDLVKDEIFTVLETGGYTLSDDDRLAIAFIQTQAQEHGTAATIAISAEIGKATGNPELINKINSRNIVGENRAEMQMYLAHLRPPNNSSAERSAISIPNGSEFEIVEMPDIDGENSIRSPKISGIQFEDLNDFSPFSINFPRSDNGEIANILMENQITSQNINNLGYQIQNLNDSGYSSTTDDLCAMIQSFMQIYRPDLDRTNITPEKMNGFSGNTLDLFPDMDPREAEVIDNFVQNLMNDGSLIEMAALSEIKEPATEKTEISAAAARPQLVKTDLCEQIQKLLCEEDPKYEAIMTYTNRLGEQLAIDGLKGPRTTEAIALYKQENGLNPNMSDKELLAHFENLVEELSLSNNDASSENNSWDSEKFEHYYEVARAMVPSALTGNFAGVAAVAGIQTSVDFINDFAEKSEQEVRTAMTTGPGIGAG